MCSTNCVGHGHGCECHSSSPEFREPRLRAANASCRFRTRRGGARERRSPRKSAETARRAKATPAQSASRSSADGTRRQKISWKDLAHEMLLSHPCRATARATSRRQRTTCPLGQNMSSSSGGIRRWGRFTVADRRDSQGCC